MMKISLHSYLTALFGEEIDDYEQETFTLFSQEFPSRNLGFVNPKTDSCHVSIGDSELDIAQSVSLLNSSRSRGTTGSVLWQVTPPVAEWLTNPSNVLFTSRLLSSSSHVLELGSGVAGIIPVALAPRVCHFWASDQDYVLRVLQANIVENYGKIQVRDASVTGPYDQGGFSGHTSSGRRHNSTKDRKTKPEQTSSPFAHNFKQKNGVGAKKKGHKGREHCVGDEDKRGQLPRIGELVGNINVMNLDWETDDAGSTMLARLREHETHGESDAGSAYQHAQKRFGNASSHHRRHNPHGHKHCDLLQEKDVDSEEEGEMGGDWRRHRFDGIDLVIACDCIYNDSLIEPFVSTCVDVCRASFRSDKDRHRRRHHRDHDGQTQSSFCRRPSPFSHSDPVPGPEPDHFDSTSHSHDISAPKHDGDTGTGNRETLFRNERSKNEHKGSSSSSSNSTSTNSTSRKSNSNKSKGFIGGSLVDAAVGTIVDHGGDDEPKCGDDEENGDDATGITFPASEGMDNMSMNGQGGSTTATTAGMKTTRTSKTMSTSTTTTMPVEDNPRLTSVKGVSGGDKAEEERKEDDKDDEDGDDTGKTTNQKQGRERRGRHRQCPQRSSLAAAMATQLQLDSSSELGPAPPQLPLPSPPQTICLIAQQLRDEIVFGTWLEAFMAKFHVWRIPDEDFVVRDSLDVELGLDLSLDNDDVNKPGECHGCARDYKSAESRTSIRPVRSKGGARGRGKGKGDGDGDGCRHRERRSFALGGNSGFVLHLGVLRDEMYET